jgi:hypothetical protein
VKEAKQAFNRKAEDMDNNIRLKNLVEKFKQAEKNVES